jgi:hypothetical protein
MKDMHDTGMKEPREPTEARQGSKEGVVRWVLLFSFTAAAIALAAILFAFLR